MRVYPSERLGRRHTSGRQRLPRAHSLLRRVLRRAAVIALGLTLLSWLPVLALRWIDPPTTAFMLLDRSTPRPPSLQWTAWREIGTALPLAVVASEDQKFADHLGFDVASIQASLKAHDEGERLRGASTISQQVAKNLFLWPGRNYLRKGLEAYFTLLIELTWPKRRILEVYLNVAEFGTGVYGIGAASQRFFDKAPLAVSTQEAALLASVLPSPKRLHAGQPTPYLRKRQAWIVTQMERLRREAWLTRLD